MSSGVLKGAYVNVQNSKSPSAQPIHYMEPSATMLQQQQPLQYRTGKQKYPKIIASRVGPPRVRNVILPSARRPLPHAPSPLSFKTKNSTTPHDSSPHLALRNEDIDLNSSTVNRRNSYRNANSLKIDIDATDSYQLPETDELNVSHTSGKYARSIDQNSDKDDGYEEISDVDFDEDSKSIARSFERLLNLSDEVFGQSNLERKSILADGSFELDTDTVECNDDELDGVLRDLLPPSTPTSKTAFVMPLTPSKLTLPVDAGQHRARVLSFSTSKQDNSTDIW